MYELLNGFGNWSETIETIIYKYVLKNSKETHAGRVSLLCKSMGIAMCLPDDEIRRLEVGGLFHDIGKMVIKDQLLYKEGPLTVKEWDEIMCHPEVGYMILRSSSEMSDVADFIRYHHERYDGAGYPEGLKEEEIPLLSRIICIADSYDAMINHRSYKASLDPDMAVNELVMNKGKQFDPGIVDIFIEKILYCAI